MKTNVKSEDQGRMSRPSVTACIGCPEPYYHAASMRTIPVAATATNIAELNNDSWTMRRIQVRLDPYANLIAGGVGGACSLLVGYPFDTLKVKLQTMKSKGICPYKGGPVYPYNGAIDCFKKVVRNEGGFLSLYRGVAGLLLMSAPRFALIFQGNALGLRLVGGTEKQHTYQQVFASGALSQVAVVPLVVAPCERIKVLLQIQPPESQRGQLQCLKEVLSTEGFRKGLMRGTLLTYTRDMPSFATYFLTYEFVRDQTKVYMYSDAKTVNDGVLGTGVLGTLIAGGAAGLAGWMVAIPFDTVKNRHQAVMTGSVAQTVSKLWAKQGVAGFFRGAAPILTRSVPANAAAFLGYEILITGLTYIDFHPV